MATASSSDLKKYVDEVTKCPICLEDVNKPKILPCFHTYCLECIERHSKGKLPGDYVECPCCRKKFVIPADGVDHLPHNFFINGLVDAKKLSDGDSNLSDPCDGCWDDDSSAEHTTAATMFCTFCLQKLCERCSKPHSRVRGGVHKVVSYGSEEKVKAIKSQSSYCNKHNGNKLELHCMTCNENLCVICQISRHRSHDCQAIVDVHDEFVEILQKDSANLAKQEQKLIQQLEILEQKKLEYSATVAATEKETANTAQNIKRVVDDTVGQLTKKLHIHARDAKKSCEELKSQVEISLVARSSLLRYSEKLLLSGNHCDIADAYKGLHTRAEELLADDKQTIAAADYEFPTVPATPDAVYNKVYGYLRDQSSVVLVHSFSPDKPVAGITTLEEKLYVLYEGHGSDIAVFDKVTFHSSHRLSVKGRGDCKDIASCQRYQCIYLADMWNKVIHRIEKANNKHTKWSIGEDKPTGLSVNSEYNVIVTLCDVHKVKVFTTHGELVNEIDLQLSGIEHPWHAIQLATDKYMVCHGRFNDNVLHRVVIIDGSGRIIQTFGRYRGSDNDQLNVPSKLALMKNGFISVADRYNQRLVILNKALREVKCLDFTADPFRLWYDVETDRLYVGVNKWNAESRKYTSGHIEVYKTE